MDRERERERLTNTDTHIKILASKNDNRKFITHIEHLKDEAYLKRERAPVHVHA